MNYLLYGDGLCQTPLFKLTVEKDHRELLADIYVDGVHAVSRMKALAEAFPGSVVKLSCMARNKAVLADGQLTVRAMDTFYDNLTEKERNDTRILVGPGEWK